MVPVQWLLSHIKIYIFNTIHTEYNTVLHTEMTNSRPEGASVLHQFREGEMCCL